MEQIFNTKIELDSCHSCDYSHLNLLNNKYDSYSQLSEFLAINSNSTTVTSQCSAHIFNRAKHSNFSSVFGSEWNSIGTEFQMVCDNSWQNGLISASTFIGFAIGSIFGGSFADKYGRKFTMMFFSVLLGIVMIIHGLVPGNIWTFACFRMVESLFVYAAWISILTWTAEIFGPSKRHIGCIVQESV